MTVPAQFWLTGPKDEVIDALARGVDSADGRARETPLHLLVHRGDKNLLVEAARRLDVNARDGYGRTPLHLAAKHHDAAKGVEATTVLLEQGADISAPDAHDVTPLDLAIGMLNVPILRAMLRAGASLEHVLTQIEEQHKGNPMTASAIQELRSGT